jgi:dCTP deaminase
MVLNDVEIEYRAIHYNLIDPFDLEQLQPASYDMRLSKNFRVFSRQKMVAIDLDDPDTYKDATEPVEADEFVLHPGEFVLGSTVEIVDIPPAWVARIEGKSSLGRLGLIIHATAGFCDPGFNGAVTLEMANLAPVPIILRANKLICQMSFQQMNHAARKPYDGRYQGDLTVAPSRY